MGIVKARRYLLQNGDHFLLGQGTTLSLHPIREGAICGNFHGDEMIAVGLPHLEDIHNEAMFQPLCVRPLALEAF